MIIIIGGGAAGIFAAITAASRLKQRGITGRVTVLERNALPLRKLGITGKGRCNLTNNCDMDALLSHTVDNPKFLYSAFSAFPPASTLRFFENELHVPLKTERGNRVFPLSDKAGEIVHALRGKAAALGVNIVNDRAADIITTASQTSPASQKHGKPQVTAVTGGQGVYPASSVIVATGGLSYPATGSTGDGYAIAKALGHTVKPCRGILNGLQTTEDCAELSGLSLKNVRLSLIALHGGKKRVLYSDQGEMLFTGRGISGPLVLSASAYYHEGESHKVSVDLKPALTEEQLDLRLLREIGESPKRAAVTMMGSLLPKSLCAMALKKAGIAREITAGSLTKAQRKAIVLVLKDFSLTIFGAEPIAEAVVTSGGISTREIHPTTMQSKLVDGLFFAGEVMDVAALTGGFNLQIAWSTGFAAGIAAADKEE